MGRRIVFCSNTEAPVRTRGMELQQQEVVKWAHQHIFPAHLQDVLGVAPTHSCRLPGEPIDVLWVP